MKENNGCHYVHDIAKKHGWEHGVITQLIHDAGILEINKKVNEKYKYRRFLNDEEYQQLEKFIKNPTYRKPNSANAEYWGTPLFLRIN